MDLIDIKRAHMNSEVLEPTHVELPEERRKLGVRGRLVYCLYGTRPAAHAWEEHYSKRLVDQGFIRGRSSPCIFVHGERGIIVVQHGDDFHVLAIRRAWTGPRQC